MTVSKRNALSKLVFTQMKDTVLIRTCKYLVVSGHFLLYINGYFILLNNFNFDIIISDPNFIIYFLCKIIYHFIYDLNML